MKSENKYAKFFHLHPELLGVGAVLAVFLFTGIGAPGVTRGLALPWGTAPAAMRAAQDLMQSDTLVLPKVWSDSDCEKLDRRREALRQYLRRELEERARQKPGAAIPTPRRSRVELI